MKWSNSLVFALNPFTIPGSMLKFDYWTHAEGAVVTGRIKVARCDGMHTTLGR